ncbi:hypothetical protein Btru_068972 [Bulinus truncatus]|nr:hypothetical protein Btru_068972 [Bulinus truncatus]
MKVLKLMLSRRHLWRISVMVFSLCALSVLYLQSPVHFVLTRMIPQPAFYGKFFVQTERGGCRKNYSIQEVDEFILQYQGRPEIAGTVFQIKEDEPYLTFLSRINTLKKKGKEMKQFIKTNSSWAWEKFHEKINEYYLYDPTDSSYYDQLLKDLLQRDIVFTDINYRSSHLVLIVTFDNGGKATYKFMRTPREHEVLPNHFFFSDIERPQAEIASFHLDKVLGFYKVPPTVGRAINITQVIQQVGVPLLTNTLHRSPAGNLCFFGKCKDYCKVDFSICGQPDTIEGAMSVYLPNRSLETANHNLASPWMRMYNPILKAKWESSEDFCDTDVKTKKSFQGRRILDFSDIGVFDFLIGNLDRHHVELFEQLGNETFLIHFDNGRGFGKSKYDCMSCMAPVRQCCLIRLSTLAKLVKLYIGPDSLSHVLRESLKADPIHPVLWEPHLDALDRRVGKILQAVSDCVIKKGKAWQEVVIDDGLN